MSQLTKRERRRADLDYARRVARLERRIEVIHELAVGLQAASIELTGQPVAVTRDPTLRELLAGLLRDREAAGAELNELRRIRRPGRARR
jgi:hypothetical protein